MKDNLLKALAFISMLIFSGFASGQIANWRDSAAAFGRIARIDDQIEKTAEVLQMEHDYSDLVEDFIDLASKPVNLNSAKAEDLAKIPFLSPVQCKNLLNYLETYGEVLSIFELQSIKGFDSVLVQTIRPFITISPPSHVPSPSPGNLVRFGHYTLMLRYEQTFPMSSGYLASDSARMQKPDSYYLGSPQRYYFRYDYSWFDKIMIGIAGEKDPGEQFFRGAQRNGMDFYATYLCLANLGILKNLIIGNFRVTYGQGLTIGSGLSMCSVPGFASGISMPYGIRPCLGMSEESYLRGLAATLKIRPFEISGFASCHPRDATVSHTDSTSSLAEEITSFGGTGYHRTGSELAKRNALTELVCGGNINFTIAPSQQTGIKIGLTGSYSRYSAAVVPRIYPYNQFGFHGDHNLNTGIDFQLRHNGMYFFGEFSRSLNGGLAWLTGTIISPDPGVCISLICRNYQSLYQNLFGNAFGQNSQNSNEQGIYVSVSAAVHPKLDLSGYLDLFQFPWLKYRVDAPTYGHEFGMMAAWHPSRNVIISLRFFQKKLRNNEMSVPDQIVHKLCNNLTRSFRVGIELMPVEGIMLKTRLEVKEAGESTVKLPFGYFIYQEAQIKLSKWPETITFRFALFDIPDYASRIYVYEPEVLYGYSVPAYQGRGIRTCFVLKFGIARKIDLWVRGGVTYYADRNEVGSGLDLTKGNVREDLTGQLLIKL